MSAFYRVESQPLRGRLFNSVGNGIEWFFGKRRIAMTAAQCLHYCLTRPGVVSVLSGARTKEELLNAAAYCDLPDEKKDFAALLGNTPAHRFKDKSMYCGHCAPCTVGIDIAVVNKFADLCEAQHTVPETV